MFRESRFRNGLSCWTCRWTGAEVQSILTTILVTTTQQTINPLDFLKPNLTATKPALITLSAR